MFRLALSFDHPGTPVPRHAGTPGAPIRLRPHTDLAICLMRGSVLYLPVGKTISHTLRLSGVCRWVLIYTGPWPSSYHRVTEPRRLPTGLKGVEEKNYGGNCG